MLSKDEVWEIMQLTRRIPINALELEWLFSDRRRVDLFEFFLKALCARSSS